MTHSGTITTRGSGITSAGGNNVITNSGSILVDGNDDAAISVNVSSSVINSGTIVVEGDAVTAIYTSGSGNFITHSGSISTSGEDGHGIFAASGTSSSYNDIVIEAGGQIITAGATAYGIYLGDYAQLILEAADATAGTSAGSIATSGAGAHGIYAEGSTTIATAGDIATSGSAANGIYLNGTGNTLPFQEMLRRRVSARTAFSRRMERAPRTET